MRPLECNFYNTLVTPLMPVLLSAPNRFASHFFLMKTSELYRAVSGEDLSSEALDLDLLGKKPNKKSTP